MSEVWILMRSDDVVFAVADSLSAARACVKELEGGRGGRIRWRMKGPHRATCKINGQERYDAQVFHLWTTESAVL